MRFIHEILMRSRARKRLTSKVKVLVLWSTSSKRLLEQLASRKLVYREVCNEVSETAKVCTKEHELNTEASTKSRACTAKRRRCSICRGRFSRDRPKDEVLTQRGLGIHELKPEKSAEVIVLAATSQWKDWRTHKTRKD